MSELKKLVTVSELWISNFFRRPIYVSTFNIPIVFKKKRKVALKKIWRLHIGNLSWIPFTLYFLPQNLFQVKRPQLSIKKNVPITSSSEVGGVL